ncbi:MAG TPA: HAD-IC family P-type ATPase [Eubacteriales bacterium]|nr:HAD-IC family P-type ATPase [Eubacteriales bacterium]HRU83935.1 HAD-IC family P-type ATPase [Eubacteriales bacterium]
MSIAEEKGLNLAAESALETETEIRGTDENNLSFLAIGLTAEEVRDKTERGEVNGDLNIRTKSFGKIIVSNVFTLFNIINFILAALIFSVQPFTDAVVQCGFLILIFLNMFSGLIQEIRAKITIDKLSLLSAPKCRVIRDGEEKEIAIKDIALGELMVFTAGCQICADSEVLFGTAEVNEALVTGEPDAVLKTTGSKLLSGSFVVSGEIKARATAVGADNYAQKISAGAKYIKKPNSDIVVSLKAIIRLMSFVVVPLGVALFLKSYLWDKLALSGSVLAMTASMISMIPQGLVALTSVVFAISIIKLSKHNTLVQDLYCIETLARVDVLCLDKTGTITEGSMVFEKLHPAEGVSEQEMEEAITALVGALSDNNPTFMALRERFFKEGSEQAVNVVPFSSKRKWSGAAFANGSFMMGASEFLLKSEDIQKYSEIIAEYSGGGSRVMALVKTNDVLSDYEGKKDVELMGFILITDKIRDEAESTLKFFAEQGVQLKIISGDNHLTVAAVAKRAGLIGADNAVDATTLKTEEEILEAAEKYTVFGRVVPEQKLMLIKALKAQGHTVAMTGDGVNDVLALKEADCSVAMASGSDAARTVSQLVLLDSNFKSMPKIVAEGRRNINNLQRTAGLYLTKTVYSLLLGILFVIPWVGAYPYEPIHLTFVGGFAIGIPSALLALAPNEERVKGRFINTTMARALPGALTLFLCIVSVQIGNILAGVSADELSTVCVVAIGLVSFAVLFRISLPVNPFRLSLFILMFGLFFLCWWILTADPIPFISPLIRSINISLIPFQNFTMPMLYLLIPAAVIAVVSMVALTLLFETYAKKRSFNLIAKILRVK